MLAAILAMILPKPALSMSAPPITCQPCPIRGMPFVYDELEEQLAQNRKTP
jgi:hypothetical protein